MHSAVPLETLAPIVPLIFAGIFLYLMIYYLKTVRQWEDTPTSKIRSAAQGYAEFSGTLKVLGNKPIQGKMTHKPCVWYRYRIEQLFTQVQDTQNNQTVSEWRVIEQGQSEAFLVLEDGTGLCVLLPQQGRIFTEIVDVWYGNSLIPAPLPSQQSWLFWLFNARDHRYTEYRLEENKPLFVTGLFRSVSKMDPFLKNYPELLQFMDQNRVNSINILDWDTKEGGEKLMVSEVPRKKLGRAYRYYAFFSMMAFLVCAYIASNMIYYGWFVYR